MASDFTQISAIFKSKLEKFFRFAKFVFWPKNRVLKLSLVFIVLFSTIILGRNAYALEAPGLEWLFGILSYIFYAIAYFLGWLAMKIFALLVLISSYNDFVTSPAVNKGWVLTRDVSNLFFVLVLLVIAFCQILHVERYKLQQILPTLLIAAVLVNFSKLICALIIDFAQVVMMTFVNGYAATAGANLINGLGLSKIMQMDEGQAPKLSHLDVFIAMELGVFILIMVVIVTFFILLLFVIRIATLWILIVLSPFAFVLEVVPIGGLKEKAAKWWHTFGMSVAIGPIMAFFLWLSLAIMANPEEMISTSTEAIDQKSATSVVSKMSLVDNMARSAIGLAMLMSSLMAAQEAGGIIGGMAGKFKGMAEKAATGIVKRGTGYSTAAKLGTAYKKGGWAEVAKTGMVGGALAKVGLRGKGLAKKVGAMPFTGGAALTRAAGGALAKTAAGAAVIGGAKTMYTKAKSKAGGAMAGVAKLPGVKQVATVAKGAWASTANVGTMEEVTLDNIRKEKFEKKRKEGEALLGARGIKGEAGLKAAMDNAGAPKNLRIAAAMKLAEDGKLDDAKRLQAARDLVKGDRDAEKTLQDNTVKHNAHLSMDLKIPDNREKMATMIREGKVDISQQSTSALQNTELLQVAMQTLGPKVFADKLGDASKKSVAHKDAVKTGVSALAAAEHRDLAAKRETVEKMGDGPEKEKARKEVDDQRQNIQNVVANVTSDLNLAFGQRDPGNGEVVKETVKDKDGKEVLDKDGKKIERTPIDKDQEEALQKYVGRMSPKQLASTEMEDDALTHIARHVRATQLDNLVKSHEENALPNLEKIIQKAMDEGRDDLIAKVASKVNIMGAISNDLANKVKNASKKVGADGGGAGTPA